MLRFLAISNIFQAFILFRSFGNTIAANAETPENSI